VCIAGTLTGNPDLWLVGAPLDLDAAFPAIVERTE
jgi:hypothetical protein